MALIGMIVGFIALVWAATIVSGWTAFVVGLLLFLYGLAVLFVLVVAATETKAR